MLEKTGFTQLRVIQGYSFCSSAAKNFLNWGADLAALSDEEAERVLNHALESGINILDMATDNAISFQSRDTRKNERSRHVVWQIAAIYQEKRVRRKLRK